MRTLITADGTGKLLITNSGANNAYVFVAPADDGGDLGGGTLKLGIKDKGENNKPLMPLNTIIGGSQNQYPIGGDVELHYTLTGATNPSIDIMVTQGN
jgi:hypothetical protein